MASAVQITEKSLFKSDGYNPFLHTSVMRMYLALIVLLFLVVLIGAGWLLRRSEEEYRAEMKQLQEENEYLRDKVNRLTAHELRNI